MTEPAPPPAKDASAEEIEADIEATRGRLAESVDVLADRVNVKARAQEKVDQARQQAREKVDQARSKGTDLLGRAKQAPPPVQLALLAAPVLVLLVVILRRIRRRS